MSSTNYILSKKPTGSIVSDTLLPASLSGLRGPKGDIGPGNTLAVGGVSTVTTPTANASLTGNSPNQLLYLTLPSAQVTAQSITNALGYTPIGDAKAVAFSLALS